MAERSRSFYLAVGAVVLGTTAGVGSTVYAGFKDNSRAYANPALIATEPYPTPTVQQTARMEAPNLSPHTYILYDATQPTPQPTSTPPIHQNFDEKNWNTRDTYLAAAG